MNTNTAAALMSQNNTGLDSEVLDNVSAYIPDLWAGLHRVAHAPGLQPNARDRINQVIGAMPGMWAVLLQLGERKFRNAEQRRALYRAVLEESNARQTLAREMCNLLGIMASRTQAIRSEGSNRKLNRGLSDSFWGLVGTGVFSQVPNTFCNAKVFGDSLERYCEELRSFWRLANSFDGGVDGSQAKNLVARITGLSLFDGVRLQAANQLDDSVGQLMLWYQRPQARRQRGFYAGVAQGVHELGMIRAELVAAIAAAAPFEKEALRRAKKLVEKHTLKLVMTGILSVVPA